MSISSLFRSKPVAKLPSYTSSEVSHSARKVFNQLKHIQSTVETKGDKVSSMYQKTGKYALKLIKSAEKENKNDILKNAGKLHKHSANLFRATSNPFTTSAITAAEAELTNIALALLKTNSVNGN